MKFTVTRENLKAAIGKLINIISSKMTMPALNNILIEAEGDTLRMTASDLEISVRTTVTALIFEPGETTLPAKKLQQIASELPAGDVTIEINEEDVATISCQRSLFKIHGLPASSYQTPDDFQEDWTLTLPARDLVKNLAKVAYARSIEESRRALNGVLFSVRNGTLTIAATDGRRLALVEKVLDGDTKMDGDIILPTKVTQELQRSLDVESTVTIRMSNAMVMFSTPDTCIISKLIEGVYPNYRQVIPPSFGRKIDIPRITFTDALRRASIVISEDHAAVKLSLSQNSLVVSAFSQDIGEASEPVDVEYNDEPMEISFNPQFFSDPLKVLECDNLTMHFTDDLSPVELCGDEGFLYILMPMRG